MKPIRVFIRSSLLDAYIYAGHLFAVFTDGTLRVLPLIKVFEKLESQCPELASVLKLAILRNDWLLNPQMATLFYANYFLDAFTSVWQKATVQDFHVDLENEDWQVMWELPSLPIYDMRVYAMRVYLGHREGIHEGLIRIVKNEVRPHNGLAKVFDARTISISARSGELLFSADDEGLFHGSLWDNAQVDSHTTVSEKSYAKKSLRTGWKGFDFLNYEKNSHFAYVKNEIQRVSQKQRTYIYSQTDESSEKIRISKLATDTYPMESFFSQSYLFPLDEVQYCFNDSKSSFFFLRDGHFLKVNWTGAQQGARLSSKFSDFLETSGKNILGKPCSAIAFPSGCVIEFFDRVVLVHDDEIFDIENHPAVSVRTFPTSKRFRRLVCVTCEDGVALHAVFPARSEVLKEAYRAISEE